MFIMLMSTILLQFNWISFNELLIFDKLNCQDLQISFFQSTLSSAMNKTTINLNLTNQEIDQREL